MSETFAALCIASVVFNSRPPAKQTDKTEATQNFLVISGLFVTVAVALWTTALIVFRIYSTSKYIKSRAKPRFYHIVAIIMQSSLIYSFAVVALASFKLVPNNGSDGSLLATGNNVKSLFLTLMVC